MTKHEKSLPSRIVIFVEGDTDELLFKALLDYYKSISPSGLQPCMVCNLRGVTRYTSKLLAKLQNEYLPDARKNGYTIQTVCCSYDTDVFEKGNPLIINWGVLKKSVHRLGISTFIQIGVHDSIEDWILDDMEGVSRFLKLKETPKSLKGRDGYEKMLDLYGRARKLYQKGYATRELIAVLNMDVIRRKRRDALALLEEAIGVQV
jgi:hypothetical protein